MKRPKLRGLLPSLILTAILPLTLLLSVFAIGATTLHQNEMRHMIALHNAQIVRAAAQSLAERIDHHLTKLRALAEAAALTSPREVVRRLDLAQFEFDDGVAVDDGATLTSTRSLITLPDGRVLAQARSTDGAMAAYNIVSARELELPVLADAMSGMSRLHVLLVDAQAQPLYHTDPTPIQFEVQRLFAEAIDHALRGESATVFVTDPDRVEWVVAYAPVPATGWALIVAQPWEDVVNPLLRTSLLTPLLLIPAIVIAVIAIFFGARRIIRPLQQLDAQAARAGQGDFAALAQPIDGIEEIQTLHTTLARLADQIRRYQRSLQSYAADVLRGQEDERSRLAHELHDETVQALVALDQRLQLLDRTAKRDPQAALIKLGELRALTAATIDDVRRVIRDLRPIYLEDLGLVPALEMLLQSLRQPDRPELALTVDGEPRRLSPEVELAVYRIVQEALNNAIKHAHAQRVEVKVICDAELRVTIGDDGVGFAVPDRVETLTELGHFGLIGLRERAELIGAQLTIASSPRGTTVELRLPS